MNRKTLNIRMRDNYSNIANKMTAAEKAWAEKFETMEYALERGHAKTAERLQAELRGRVLTAEEAHTVDEIIETKLRCNPARAEAQQRYEAKRWTRDRKAPSNMYDPTDFIDQRFDSQGYEQAVALSPEDAIIDAIDAARAANSSIDDLLNGTTTWTKSRGKGRPRKESV